MANGADIIIKADSVDIDYDETFYPRDLNDHKKHKNQNKKVTRVLITGDITFDSGEHPNGLHCEITAFCK
ncbi:MAG: hypothetical protein QOF62_3041 [Pyrinomonadaceae bacterium]|jgi:hypothetical protein|nr:hypothetical protein [Pyrinomonadaceae bacterium]